MAGTAIVFAGLAGVPHAEAVYDTPSRVLDGIVPDTVDVSGLRVSPDGGWLVFVADLEEDQQFELWSVPLGGPPSPPIRLSGEVVDGGDVIPDPKISADSRLVAFRGDLIADGVIGVHTTAIDGSSPRVDHSVGAAPGGNVNHVVFTPDSTAIVYQGDLLTDGTVDLFSSATEGPWFPPGIRLNGSNAGDVLTYEIASDNEHVVYLGDVDTKFVYELFSARVGTTGSEERLHPPLGSGGRVASYTLAPDASRVAYTYRADGDSEMVLASTAIDGSSLVAVVSDSPLGGDVLFGPLVTADSSTVVYRGRLDADDPDRVDLWANGITGISGQVRLSDRPINAGSTTGGVRLSPDGQWAVYRSPPASGEEFAVWSVRVDGSAPPVRLSDPPTTGDGDTGGVSISPDSTSVAFRASLSTPSVFDLHARRIDGAGPQHTVSVRPPGSDAGLMVSDWRWAEPNRLVYLLDPSDGPQQLYSRVADASAPQVRLNTDLVEGDQVSDDYVLPSDGSFVVYLADHDGLGRQEPWATARHLTPARPGGVTVDPGRTIATVTWTQGDRGSAVTSTAVTAMPTSAAASAVTMVVSGGATEAVLRGLEPATTYEVQVRATNDAGASTPSLPVSFTTLAPASDGPPGVVRLFGSDRYATAAAIAKDRFAPSEVAEVVLVTGTTFPDALAGGPLAAARGAPILLATSDTLPEPTQEALRHLAPERVLVLGGTTAIGDEVAEAAAAAAGGTGPPAAIVRLAGIDRYATGVEIARELGDADTVFLATGTNFPDALAGGPATDGAPILLVAPTEVPPVVADALGELAPTRIVALGGDAAISDQALAAAAAAAGTEDVDRWFGANRFGTAVAVADALPTPTTVYVATGTAFPDALAAGPAAAGEGAPILLTRLDDLPQATVAWLDALPGLRRIVLLGGTAAVSTSVEQELAALLDGT